MEFVRRCLQHVCHRACQTLVFYACVRESSSPFHFLYAKTKRSDGLLVMWHGATDLTTERATPGLSEAMVKMDQSIMCMALRAEMMPRANHISGCCNLPAVSCLFPARAGYCHRFLHNIPPITASLFEH